MSRRADIHVTQSGIHIGGHYVPPGEQFDRDAELLQQALIDPPTRLEVFLTALDRHALRVMLALCLVGAVVGIGKAIVRAIS